MTPRIGDRHPGDAGRHHDVEGGVQVLVRGDGGVGAVGDRLGAAVLIADAAAHIEIQLAAGGAPVVLEHDGVRRGHQVAGTLVSASLSVHDDLLVRFGATGTFSRARPQLRLVERHDTVVTASMTPVRSVLGR
jgi:hypothetical protein